MKSKTLYTILSLMVLLLLNACSSDKSTSHSKDLQFSFLGNEATRIDFKNDIVESEKMNVVNYEYLYNGGGVGVGDFNNDGLQDLVFTGTMVQDMLYINKGNFQFEKVEFALDQSNGFSTGVCVLDINNDGLEDIYICRTGKGEEENRKNELYINKGNLQFKEEADVYGIGSGHHSNHAAFFDFDLDGDLDLYVLNHPIDFKNSQKLRVKPSLSGGYERILDPKTEFDSDQLFENLGNNTFQDVSDQAGVHNYGFGLSVSILDVNNDFYPDIYVANDYIEPDILYVNQKNGSFKRDLANYFDHVSENSMGSDWADINNDGFNDLIVVDMIAEGNYRQKTLVSSMSHERYHTLKNLSYHPQHMRNVVQLNNGSGKFSEIGHLLGVSNTDWSWAPLMVDLDNDGLKDLFVSNGYRRDLSDCDYTLYKSDSLTKSKVKDIQEYLENIPETPIRNYLYKNMGDLEFKDISIESGIVEETFSNGTVFVDLDNNGFLDIVINNVDTFPIIYRNNNTEGHYLNVNLEGVPSNKDAIEARLLLYANSLQISERITGNRGYFSSVQKLAHFGLGKIDQVDSLIVIWPDKQKSVYSDLPIDTSIVIKYSIDQAVAFKETEIGNEVIFEEQKNTKLKFTHQENSFDDLRTQHLLPHCLSNFGPSVKYDRESDLWFFGGAFDQASEIHAQGITQVLEDTESTEDLDAVFIDFDKDGDKDLYVVAGGNSKPLKIENYQDHFYVNENGKYKLRNDLIPIAQCSGGTVTKLDFDNDGDEDLFIGGRLLPGNYPYAPLSYLFENTGEKFKDVTEQKAEVLKYLGMISESDWVDLDQDGDFELIVCGEFLPISIFQYKNGKFEAKPLVDIYQYKGWWNSMKIVDIDLDGDLDIIAGNLGKNAKYKASNNKPYSLYVHDFDDNGRVDPIACQYYGEQSYPIPARGDILKQLPVLQRRLVSYRKYAECTIDDLFTQQELSESDTLIASNFSTSLFINEGQDFKHQPLPIQSQFAPVYAIESFNHNGRIFILTGGNNTAAHVESGPYDASRINLYEYANGKFKYYHSLVTGLDFNKEVRSLNVFNKEDAFYLVVGLNNDRLKEFRINTDKL